MSSRTDWLEAVEEEMPGNFGVDAHVDGEVAVGGDGSSPGGVIYKVDSSRAGFGELLRDQRGPGVIFAWVAKLLRVRLPGSVNDPNVESLQPFEVALERLPQEVTERTDARLRELAHLGFSTDAVVAHRIDDFFNNSRTAMLSMPRPDGRALARLVLRTEGSSRPPRTHFYTEFLSELPDGRFLVTTGAGATLDAPEGVEAEVMRDATASTLWARHQARLRSAGSTVPCATPDAVRSLLERHHYLLRDFHLRRRLFVPLNEAEQENARFIGQSFADAEARGDAFPEIHAEMQRLQRPNSNRTGALVVLGLSVLLFLVIGLPGLRGDDARPNILGNSDTAFQTLLIIVGLLFFHEMGHFVAMRLFGYRNVRMFFIPMLGAAVSGVNYGAPGWKRVVVALMGPLPGIALGIAVGIAGIMQDRPIFVSIALLSLILNGFNLLPILPLDGGQVAQSILFSRHYGLDIAFRIIAAALLILGGLLVPGGLLLSLLGVVMLVGIPAVLRVAKIAAELRGEEYLPPPQSPGAASAGTAQSDAIPPALAREIVERVERSFSKSPLLSKLRNHKLLAQHSLAVYERLTTRPPGWVASIAFGTLHASSFVVAFIAAVGLTLAARPDFLDFTRAAAAQPRWTISAEDIVALPAAPLVADAVPPALSIAANFDSESEARDHFAQVSAMIDETERIARVGPTILVSLAEPLSNTRRAHWFDELESRSSDVFAVGSGSAAHFRIMLLAPTRDVAERLDDALRGYFSLPVSSSLTPPWQPEEAAGIAPPDEAAQRARRTYLALQDVQTDLYDDAHFDALDEELEAASRRGDTEALRAHYEKRQEYWEQLETQALESFAAANDGRYDETVIEQYLQLRQDAFDPPATQPGTRPADEDEKSFVDDEDYFDDMFPFGASTERYREMAQRMGSLPLDDDHQPLPTARLYRATAGFDRVDLLLRIEWLSLDDPVTALPHILRWLEREGGQSLKFEAVGPGGYGRY